MQCSGCPPLKDAQQYYLDIEEAARAFGRPRRRC